MIGLWLALAAAPAVAGIRLAVDAVSTEVLIVNPGPSAAFVAIRPSGSLASFVLPIGAGEWTALPVPPGLDTDSIVFDCAGAEGWQASGLRIFASGDRLRRTLALLEPETSLLQVTATEHAIDSSATGSGGSCWNLTIGPPPTNPKVGDLRSGILFPNGSIVAEPLFEPVGGYHPPF